MHVSDNRRNFLFVIFTGSSASLEGVNSVKVLHAWHICWEIVSHGRKQGGLPKLTRTNNHNLSVFVLPRLLIHILKYSLGNHLLPGVHGWVYILPSISVLNEQTIFEEILEAVKITGERAPNLVGGERLCTSVLILDYLRHLLQMFRWRCALFYL